MKKMMSLDDDNNKKDKLLIIRTYFWQTIKRKILRMKRTLFCTAIAAVALTSCSSDDFLGDVPGNNPSAVTAKEISFSGEAGKTSRAGEDKSGVDAATALNNKFVVFGTKTSNNTPSTVYDHYNVEYKTSAWEYKGLDFNSLNEKSKTAGETKQSLKYWDYSASQYDFVAFSFGNATQGTGDDHVEASKVDKTNFKYTLTGKIDELVKCYIADRVTVETNGFNQKVSFTFHPLGTKVNIGLYEVIEGYSVKDVKFYSSAEDANPSDIPTLFASTATIPTGTEKEVITVSYDENKKVKTEWNAASTASPARPLVTRGAEATAAANKSTTITFDHLSKVGAEGLEGGSEDYLGRDKTTGSISKPTNPKAILPCGNVGELTLKVDYTLVSTDGSGETIKVTGATAKVADTFTNWTANKSFTYIFKISQKTNGTTGGTGATSGLYPIEFDSVIATEGTGGNPEDIELNSNN